MYHQYILMMTIQHILYVKSIFWMPDSDGMFCNLTIYQNSSSQSINQVIFKLFTVKRRDKKPPKKPKKNHFYLWLFEQVILLLKSECHIMVELLWLFQMEIRSLSIFWMGGQNFSHTSRWAYFQLKLHTNPEIGFIETGNCRKVLNEY